MGLFKKNKGVNPDMYKAPEQNNSAARSETPAPSYSTNSFSGGSYPGAYSAGSGYDTNMSKSGYNMQSIRNDPYARKDMPPMRSGAAVAPSGYERPSYQRAPGSQTTLDLKKQELFQGARLIQESSENYLKDDGEADLSNPYSATAEEDEDVEAIKQKIQFVKQDSLSSTRNALQMANNAEQIGMSTLQNLGQQTEKVASAEKDLDVAKIHAKRAEEQARELKTLNRSMFAIHIGKPWGKGKRIAAEEARLTAKRESERQDEILNRQFAFQSQRRIGETMKKNQKDSTKTKDTKGVSILERSRYQFEPDAEDDLNEKEIDKNLDQLDGVVGRLKGLAYATGQEVESQNSRLGKIHDKSDRLDTDVYLNVERLRNIH
ncbi:t-SNARE component Sec9 [Schizosaccharomyces cryophilus OY26]|uniref:t-SNARE component Sec9 n=1 Tax=Schizosaccharomyces cryophilus (strain OY26 / ATCC MYA-4695 / CBS 11777 / NBRC 106824 / NRRL Y48691) TaxID=653667 RepID=S9W115_SCHCR|nr:t-SNARE component Sec9 [Schizosaccharomyces cryophilus OY26]EPY53593.1 t-SNARE component Sec9 [Schizosaccharomyces cryophilus OY26]